MGVEDASLAALPPTLVRRAELALLIASCTDGMRRDITAIFPKTIESKPMATSPSPLPGEAISFQNTKLRPSSPTCAADVVDADPTSPQMQAMRSAADSIFEA